MSFRRRVVSGVSQAVGQVVPPSILTGVLVAVLTAVVAEAAHATPVTFRHKPSVAAQSVTLAGSFNQWDMGATPMEETDGIWSVTVDLPTGRHQYKFVVNGSDWVTDEWATDFADDGFGGENSVIVVGDRAMDAGYGSRPEGPGGETIELAPRTPVTFRFALDRRANAVSVAGDFNGWDAAAAPMEFVAGVWAVTMELEPGAYAYQFVVDGDAWVDMEGLDGVAETEPDGFGGHRARVEVGDEAEVVEVE